MGDWNTIQFNRLIYGTNCAIVKSFMVLMCICNSTDWYILLKIMERRISVSKEHPCGPINKMKTLLIYYSTQLTSPLICLSLWNITFPEAHLLLKHNLPISTRISSSFHLLSMHQYCQGTIIFKGLKGVLTSVDHQFGPWCDTFDAPDLASSANWTKHSPSAC